MSFNLLYEMFTKYIVFLVPFVSAPASTRLGDRSTSSIYVSVIIAQQT